MMMSQRCQKMMMTSAPLLSSTVTFEATPHGARCMTFRGGEEILGQDWGLGKYRILIHTVSGRAATVEVVALAEIEFLPFTIVAEWLQ